MKTYHARVLVPEIIEIKAKDDAEALQKVAEFYKKLYTAELCDWIHPEQLPEDIV